MSAGQTGDELAIRREPCCPTRKCAIFSIIGAIISPRSMRRPKTSRKRSPPGSAIANRTCRLSSRQTCRADRKRAHRAGLAFHAALRPRSAVCWRCGRASMPKRRVHSRSRTRSASSSRHRGNRFAIIGSGGLSEPRCRSDHAHRAGQLFRRCAAHALWPFSRRRACGALRRRTAGARIVRNEF